MLAEFERALQRAIGFQCLSLLDVGCGFNSPVGRLTRRPRFVVGVDTYAPVIEQSRAQGIHDDYVNCDVLAIGEHFAEKAFDVVLAADLIEHLPKEKGLQLLQEMERIARRRVIVYTPNGFLPQDEEYGNPFQKHVSGWTVGEMRALGYDVVGVQGFRWLRGEMAKILWKPERFWLYISLLTQPIAARIPRIAFRLLCVKEMDA